MLKNVQEMIKPMILFLINEYNDFKIDNLWFSKYILCSYNSNLNVPVFFHCRWIWYSKEWED